MKNTHQLYAQKMAVSILMLLLSLLPFSSMAQSDSTAVTQEEASTLISPAVEFLSTQKTDNSVTLKALFRAKINGTVTKLTGLKTSFFLTTDSADVLLGEAITDRAGAAILHAAAGKLTPDKEGKLNFKVAYAGSKTMEATEEVLSIKRARLVLTPIKEDSVLSVQLKLVDMTTGEETPIPETNLSVYVQRMFSPLKLGEGATDEAGEVTVEIVNNLPGDAKGNITLLARLDESEDYGMVEASTGQQWGKPVSDEIRKLPRALWSTQPPMWMLISFIVLMVTVWGHYIVIVYELVRLRKEH